MRSVRGPDFYAKPITRCECGSDWTPPATHGDGTIGHLLCPDCTAIIFKAPVGRITRGGKVIVPALTERPAT